MLAGHSMGGYLLSLYASVAPHKVKALFLISPAATAPYDPETYDPYDLLDPFTLKPLTRKQTDKMLTLEKDKKSMLERF